jgi:hypothetical protein
MQKIFLAVSTFAVLVTMCIAAVASRHVGSATIRTQGHSAASMPVQEMMVGAKDLPVQSFSAF